MFLSEFSCSVMGFILTSICLLMGLFTPAARASGTMLPSVPTPDPVPGGEHVQLEAPYLHMPVYLHFRKPRVDKRHFSPAHVKSRETLPERVRRVLVPAPRRRLKSRVRQSGPVSVTCSAKEMRVRVHTAHLGVGGARVHMRLGTCDVSKKREQSVLFQYELHACDTQRQILNNTVVYSNMLHYIPDVGVSDSQRFSVPVQCHFNRFHYSYKIGFVPSVERLKFFKPIKTKGSVTLTACDAQWNRLAPAEAFVVGQPMYFEAEALSVPDGERLFIHFCHVTTDSSRASTPQVNIIDNDGCLMNSRSSSQSRFITSTRRNVVRFVIDAFMLQGKVQTHLFLHCDMSIKSRVPTETSKSCTYNQLERRWEELYGADSVCLCCDTSCVPEKPTLRRPLTSELEALVKQHPEEKSRNIPPESTEGIFTPEPEHGILTIERQHKTTVPEGTPMPNRKQETAVTERDHGMLTLEDNHRKFILENMPTSESVYEIPTAKGDHGMSVLAGKQRTTTPEGDLGMPVTEADPVTPVTVTEVDPVTTVTEADPVTTVTEADLITTEADPVTPVTVTEADPVTPVTVTEADPVTTVTVTEADPVTPVEVTEADLITMEADPVTPVTEAGLVMTEAKPVTAADLGTSTSESERGILILGKNHGTVTPDREHRILMPERTWDGDDGKVAAETPPTLDSKSGTLPPSAEQQTPAAVNKQTEQDELYLIFEEVFGLS